MTWNTENTTKIFDFQTPPDVADYMVNLLPLWVTDVLEPTPGIGNLVNALAAKSYNITAPADYWQLNKTLRFDAIVANPPYSDTTFFGAPAELGKGMKVTYSQLPILMEMADVLILLLPWFTILNSHTRLKAFKSFGLVSVTALPRKIFDNARIQTAVFHLEKGFKGDTKLIDY